MRGVSRPQSCLALPEAGALLRASGWWMSGAPALPWSGLLPKMWAIQPLLGYTVQKADCKSGVRPGWERGREGHERPGMGLCSDSITVGWGSVNSLNRVSLPRVLWGTCACGSLCWSAVAVPAAQSPTSSSATPTHFESLLRTESRARPGNRRHCRPGPHPESLGKAPPGLKLRGVKGEELARDGALRHLLVPQLLFTRPEALPRDFSEAPKFTQPLTDCTFTVISSTPSSSAVSVPPQGEQGGLCT